MSSTHQAKALKRGEIHKSLKRENWNLQNETRRIAQARLRLLSTGVRFQDRRRAGL